MTQVKELGLSGTTIFCGIDVHKKNWQVNIRTDEFELENFSQNADVEIFYNHITSRYPGATFRVCYEAGFSGFSAQRWLQERGIDCIVVNAADVITTNKDERRKTDKVDARKLALHLRSGRAEAIYVPEVAWEHGRTLVRTREKIVRDITRCKNRIWQALYFGGLKLPQRTNSSGYWRKAFVESLKQTDCGSQALQTSLMIYIKEFEYLRSLKLEAIRAIRTLCKEKRYKDGIGFIRNIPGIGPINAAVMLFEIQDISRFKNNDQLNSYAGLVPDTSQSGESSHDRGITIRHNSFLRTALVESSWQVIRRDPALLMKYKDYCKRMDRNKAIVRIAKHLLARVRYVLINKEKYEVGIVG